jgi:hypothetical protein
MASQQHGWSRSIRPRWGQTRGGQEDARGDQRDGLVLVDGAGRYCMLLKLVSECLGAPLSPKLSMDGWMLALRHSHPPCSSFPSIHLTVGSRLRGWEESNSAGLRG